MKSFLNRLMPNNNLKETDRLELQPLISGNDSEEFSDFEEIDKFSDSEEIEEVDGPRDLHSKEKAWVKAGLSDVLLSQMQHYEAVGYEALKVPKKLSTCLASFFSMEKNLEEQTRLLEGNRFGGPSFSLFEERDNAEEEKDRQLGMSLWLNGQKKRSEYSKFQRYRLNEGESSKAFLAWNEAHDAYICWKDHNLMKSLEKFKDFSKEKMEASPEYNQLPQGFDGVLEQYRKFVFVEEEEYKEAFEISSPSPFKK